jgi:hypothetical protein
VLRAVIDNHRRGRADLDSEGKVITANPGRRSDPRACSLEQIVGTRPTDTRWVAVHEDGSAWRTTAPVARHARHRQARTATW